MDCFNFILSIISYFLIERPFRDKRAISLKMVIASLLLGSILIIALQGLALRTGGFKERIPSALIGGFFFQSLYFFNRPKRNVFEEKKTVSLTTQTLFLGSTLLVIAMRRLYLLMGKRDF